MNIDGIIYSDGGMVNNYPINLVTNTTDASVGIDFPDFEILKEEDLSNMFDILTRSFDIIRNLNKSNKGKLADIYLTPARGLNLGTFDTDPNKLEEIFEFGYSFTAEYFVKHPEKLTLLKNR